MKYPKEVNRYCKNCRKHSNHLVSVYKKGKERMLNHGRRRLERKKRGYGSFPKEIFHKNAKINKRTQLMFECSECKKKFYGKSFRVKKFELQQV